MSGVSSELTSKAHRRQLETLLDTARRGSGRELDSDPLDEPTLVREFGCMRFFKQTYGFIMRGALHLAPGRCDVKDTIAGSDSSKSLFAGRDDLCNSAQEDPLKGQLMIYGDRKSVV